MLITILISTKNEENNIEGLLDSLVIQKEPIEIVVVDAGSSDNTQNIVKEYARKHPFIKLYNKEGNIGESFNYGIEKAEGEAISFIGADDKADKDWIKYVRRALINGHDIVAGKCILKGREGFELERVKLYYRGIDVSIPGTNTSYRKEILEELGGFDPSFITAEDIDLNIRAVNAGYKIYFEEKAIVYRYSRENLIGFIRQAFRNGYGRKQLVLKYGKLWKSYSLQETIKTQFTIFGILRLIFGFLGYSWCGLKERKNGGENNDKTWTLRVR